MPEPTSAGRTGPPGQPSPDGAPDLRPAGRPATAEPEPEPPAPALLPEPGPPADQAARARLIFDDPLSARSADDRDEGWGDRPDRPDRAGSATDLERFLAEKPPHHL